MEPVTEIEIYRRLAALLRLKYPKVLYRFDLAGVHNTSQYTRNLYAQLNSRAFPDLMVFAPRGNYHGFGLEIKRAGTVIWRRDGDLTKDKHIQEQHQVLTDLESQGYRTQFGIGLEDCIRKLEEYLTPPSTRV